MDLKNIEQTIEVSDLIAGYLNGTLTDSRQQELLKWIETSTHNRDLFEKICNEQNLQHTYAVFSLFDETAALTKIKDNPEFMVRPKTKVIKLWPRVAVAAAAVVATIVFGLWFYNGSRHLGSEVNSGERQAEEIAPGHNGATLTLMSGKVLQLSNAKSGLIIGDEKLTYSDGTDISFAPSGQNPYHRKGETQLLTAATAKGQTYQFTLPDGTKVWLNAASKISFPAQFNGKERRVVLEGEGYFEVAKDKAHPFIVKSKVQETEVLGTHFNIYAYRDVPYSRTTLLEGSIKVKNFSVPDRVGERILKPNQEAEIDELALNVKEVNAADAAAWKDGKFRFENTYLDDVLMQLSRWYDVDVKYPDGMPALRFTGGIDRKVNLSVALDILRDLKVKFKVEGKTILVYK